MPKWKREKICRSTFISTVSAWVRLQLRCFAFQPWHSAVEMKRYMHLFFHEMPNMNTMAALERTRYTNFHSFILPTLRFMLKKGVNFHYDRRISDVDFMTDAGGKERWIGRIHLETGSGEPMPSIEVRDTDLVFLTIGSMVSNASFGAHDRPVDQPALGSENLGGAWTLWKKIAAKQPDLGRPDRFLRDISQSKMMTFTVTFCGGLFQRKFEWLVARQMGRQSPLPITASPWILHLHTYRQPLFPNQPRDTCVIWVTALRDNRIGTFVKKTMPEAPAARSWRSCWATCSSTRMRRRKTRSSTPPPASPACCHTASASITRSPALRLRVRWPARFTSQTRSLRGFHGVGIRHPMLAKPPDLGREAYRGDPA